jgi:hypothetical protein
VNTATPPISGLTQSYDPLGQLRPVFRRLLRYATELFMELRSAPADRPRACLPRTAQRNLPAAKTRVQNALNWLIALHRTLAGDSFYLTLARDPAPNPKPAKPRPAATTRAKPLSRTQQDRDRAQLRRMRYVFTTQPTGLIAERIAKRLGLRRNDGLWPHELAGITQTPAEFRAREIAAYTATHSTPPPEQHLTINSLLAPPAPYPQSHDPPSPW